MNWVYLCCAKHWTLVNTHTHTHHTDVYVYIDGMKQENERRRDRTGTWLPIVISFTLTFSTWWLCAFCVTPVAQRFMLYSFERHSCNDITCTHVTTDRRKLMCVSKVLSCISILVSVLDWLGLGLGLEYLVGEWRKTFPTTQCSRDHSWTIHSFYTVSYQHW